MENDNEKLKVRKKSRYNLLIVIGAYLVMVFNGLVESPQMKSYGGGSFRMTHLIIIVLCLIIAIIFGVRSVKRKESETFTARGLVYMGVIAVIWSLLYTLDLE